MLRSGIVSSRIIIQIVLVIAVAAMGWMMLRSPSKTRHQASRRLITLVFVVFAVVAILAKRSIVW